MTNMRTENMGPYASHLKLTASFLQCNSLGEQEAMLASVYEDLTLHLQKMSTPHTNTVIKRVREIIAAQYMEQLSVTSLAEAVYLTPTYLCVLFKQATGKTINEYITQERLNKAKEFLAQTNPRNTARSHKKKWLLHFLSAAPHIHRADPHGACTAPCGYGPDGYPPHIFLAQYGCPFPAPSSGVRWK